MKRLLLIVLLLGCSTEPEPEDCAGVPGGAAIYDECGVCDGNGSNCISDIDGNFYKTIQIRDQLWMAENLRVTTYKDGSYISSGHTWATWIELETGAYAVYPIDDDNASRTTCGDDCADVYGNLYNWYAVDDDRGICPEGWHVPSDEEYTILTDYLVPLGGFSAGGKMKETGLEHWYSPNTVATNESGFTALPAGFRSDNNSHFYYMGYYGYFWTSSEGFESPFAWYRSLYYSNSTVYLYDGSKQLGLSVRCLGDWPAVSTSR